MLSRQVDIAAAIIVRMFFVCVSINISMNTYARHSPVNWLYFGITRKRDTGGPTKHNASTFCGSGTEDNPSTFDFNALQCALIRSS
jgi:hypothetical protein